MISDILYFITENFWVVLFVAVLIIYNSNGKKATRKRDINNTYSNTLGLNKDFRDLRNREIGRKESADSKSGITVVFVILIIIVFVYNKFF